MGEKEKKRDKQIVRENVEEKEREKRSKSKERTKRIIMSHIYRNEEIIKV